MIKVEVLKEMLVVYTSMDDYNYDSQETESNTFGSGNSNFELIDSLFGEW